MMIKTAFAAASILAVALPAAPAAAQADDSKWFARVGVTQLTLADGLDLNFAGSPVPGSAMETKSHYTPTIQAGRFIGDHFAVSLTVGLPPHIEINGGGSLQPYGKLAETTYGPAVLSLQFRPLRTGTFQPYVGAGAAYMVVFSTEDAAFQNVEIDNDLAPALEAGTDIMFNDRYGIFIDAKKAFLRTETRGTFGGAPVVGQVRLDPWAVSAGAVIRF
jgi:outer membrane protein